MRAHFLDGEVWVDLFMEEAFSHNFVKNAVYAALLPLTEGLLALLPFLAAGLRSPSPAEDGGHHLFQET